MTLELTPQPNSGSFPTLRKFVAFLMTINRTATIRVGVNLLWRIYKNPDLRRRLEGNAQLINSYGPRIIILAMAEANELTTKLPTERGFLGLCQEYLGVGDHANRGELVEQEATALHEKLIESEIIPEQYLQIEHIRYCCIVSSMMRILNSQHEAYKTNLHELLRGFRIFELWDTTGEIADDCRRRIFRMDPIHFFRSGFMLFSLANDDRREGFITFRNLIAEDSRYNKNFTCPVYCARV